MEGAIRLIWQCNFCEDVVISYSNIRHDMNYCECGVSALDLEDGYHRGTGGITEISRKIFKDKKWINIKNMTDKTIYRQILEQGLNAFTFELKGTQEDGGVHAIEIADIDENTVFLKNPVKTHLIETSADPRESWFAYSNKETDLDHYILVTPKVTTNIEEDTDKNKRMIFAFWLEQDVEQEEGYTDIGEKVLLCEADTEADASKWFIEQVKENYMDEYELSKATMMKVVVAENIDMEKVYTKLRLKAEVKKQMDEHNLQKMQYLNLMKKFEVERYNELMKQDAAENPI